MTQTLPFTSSNTICPKDLLWQRQTLCEHLDKPKPYQKPLSQDSNLWLSSNFFQPAINAPHLGRVIWEDDDSWSWKSWKMFCWMKMVFDKSQKGKDEKHRGSKDLNWNGSSRLRLNRFYSFCSIVPNFSLPSFNFFLYSFEVSMKCQSVFLVTCTQKTLIPTVSKI